MKIAILGYRGSAKSTLATHLAVIIRYQFYFLIK
jgi:shikimate kinase